MKFEYKVLFSRETFSRELQEIVVNDLILHATPDCNVDSIKANGLKVNMPRTKSITDTNAIFCTIPSGNPSTDDLFRYYDDWSIVVIDVKLIPEHKWYVDFFAENDASNNGMNKHIMTFEDIPPTAIKKIVK